MTLQEKMHEVIREIDQVQGSHYEEQAIACTKIALEHTLQVTKEAFEQQGILKMERYLQAKIYELQKQLKNLTD